MVFGISVLYIIVYIVLINGIGFFVMWWDKRQARLGNWRTPEKTLWMLTLLGGGLGTIAGMYRFRHKTKKLKFTIGFPTIVLVEIIMVVYLLIKGRGI